MGSVINWIVKHVLTAIQEHLDPTLKQQWDAVLARGRALDDAHAELNRKELDLQNRLAESEKQQTALQAQLEEVDRAIAEDETKLAASNERRRQIADDLKTTEAAIDSRPDTDRIEQPLPGTGS